MGCYWYKPFHKLSVCLSCHLISYSFNRISLGKVQALVEMCRHPVFKTPVSHIFAYQVDFQWEVSGLAPLLMLDADVPISTWLILHWVGLVCSAELFRFEKFSNIVSCGYTKKVCKAPYSLQLNITWSGLRELGEFDLAIENFNKALAVDPSDARSYHYRGLLQYQHGDHDDSLKSFKVSILADSKREVD